MNKWVLHHGLLSKASSLLGSKRKKHKYLLRVDGKKKGEYIYFYTQKEIDAYYQKKREERAEKAKDFAVNAVKKVGGAIDNAITENYKQSLSDLAEEGRSLGQEARAAKEKFKKYINFKEKVKDVVDKVQTGKNALSNIPKAKIHHVVSRNDYWEDEVAVLDTIVPENREKAKNNHSVSIFVKASTIAKSIGKKKITKMDEQDWIEKITYQNCFTDNYIKTTSNLTSDFSTTSMSYVITEGKFKGQLKRESGKIVNVQMRTSHEQVDLLPKLDSAETENASQEAVNPKYSPIALNYDEVIYSVNCDNCTAAYIMRRKGYDVEAKPYDDNYLGNSTIRGFDGVTFVAPSASNTVEEATQKVIKQMEKFGEGSYGVIDVIWDTDAGHSMVWSVENGEAIIRCTQTGQIYKGNVGLYMLFREVAFDTDTGINMARLDTCLPNDQILKAVKKRGS